MGTEKAIGKRIPLCNGEAVIKSKLGEGRQGVVYLATVNGAEQALKIYKKDYLNNLDNCQEFYDNIRRNITTGSPGKMFMWPTNVTPFGKTFGYTMPLIPAGYCEFTLFQMKTTFPDVRTRVDAMLHLVNAFRILHNKGYAYGDLNNGNFYIRPSDGHVLACDTDNITCSSYVSGIAGKMRYMAPEIVMRQKKPDKYTDRFSLAVLLFMLACKTHPLEGCDATPACMIPSYERIIYGSNPRFIFDPIDLSNGPIRGTHDRAKQLWESWPDWFREMFQRSFSRGSMTYNSKSNTYDAPRIIEKEWLEALIRLRNSISACPYCGEENIVDQSKRFCVKCGRELPIANWLDYGSHQTPVVPGGCIFKGQTRDCVDEDFLIPIARVITPENKPALPQQYGICNISSAPIAAVTSRGEERELSPGMTMPVKVGITIKLSQDRNAIIR